MQDSKNVKRQKKLKILPVKRQADTLVANLVFAFFYSMTTKEVMHCTGKEKMPLATRKRGRLARDM